MHTSKYFISQFSSCICIFFEFHFRSQDKHTNNESSIKEDTNTSDLDKIVPLLPSWVRSDMIYPEDTIEIQQLLGRGHYGCVYKGLFRNGKAVYVKK